MTGGEYHQRGASSPNYTIVIKLGSSSICDEVTHEPLISNLSLLVETAVRLRKEGHRVVIVSSGGIAMGLRRMDKDRRPKSLAAVQALAAVGQCRLIRLWDNLFDQLRQPVAQILLTRNDIADRSQYLNAANTISELLSAGVIPIVNENDTLAVQEIRFGDNDTLSAITAAMVGADYLFLMTDVDCLYTDNPRTHPEATPIEIVTDMQSLKANVSSAGSSVGTGGMSTKMVAAELATSAGVTTIITRSSKPSNIFRIVQHISGLKEDVRFDKEAVLSERSADSQSKEDPVVQSSQTKTATKGTNATDSPAEPCPPHTRFLGKSDPIRDRHFWLLHSIPSSGKITIDHGAFKALTRSNKAGLLPVGITEVQGHFAAQEAVNICVVQNNQSISVGKAIVNYSSLEVERIKGLQSSLIESVIGYSDTEYVAHRDNLAFSQRPETILVDPK